MIAIVIPFYKLIYFKNTLQSLAFQTNKEFNVYIGNDASPENPIELIKFFEQKINLTYKVFDTNVGGKSLTKQWERCLEMVRGEEWVMILGDDDILAPNCIEDFYFNINNSTFPNTNVVRFATANIDANGYIISKIFYHPTKEKSKNFLFRKLKGETRSSLSEYVFKVNAVKSIGFREFPLAWFSDLLAVLEFSKFGEVFSINSAVIFFRLSNINISGRRDNLKLKNEATFLFYKYLIDKENKKFTQDQKRIFYNKIDDCVIAHKKNYSLITNVWSLYTSHKLSARKLILLKKYVKSILNIY